MINDILVHTGREPATSPRSPASRAASLGARGVAALIAGTFMLAMTAPAIADDDDDDDDRWKRRGEVSQVQGTSRHGKGVVVCEDDDDDDDCYYVRRGVPRSLDSDDDDRRDD